MASVQNRLNKNDRLKLTEKITDIAWLNLTDSKKRTETNLLKLTVGEWQTETNWYIATDWLKGWPDTNLLNPKKNIIHI